MNVLVLRRRYREVRPLLVHSVAATSLHKHNYIHRYRWTLLLLLLMMMMMMTTMIQYFN